MKVSDLTGEQLDTWVAKAEGVVISRDPDGLLFVGRGRYWAPSSDWSLGGPILEREQIQLQCLDKARPSSRWRAFVLLHEGDSLEAFSQEGATMLIAAMRCFVASKLGEDVDGDPVAVRSAG